VSEQSTAARDAHRQHHHGGDAQRDQALGGDPAKERHDPEGYAVA